MANSNNGNESKANNLLTGFAAGVAGVTTFFTGVVVALRPGVKNAIDRVGATGNTTMVTSDLTLRHPVDMTRIAFRNSTTVMGASVALFVMAAVGAGWLVNKLRNSKSHAERYEDSKLADQSSGRGIS